MGSHQVTATHYLTRINLTKLKSSIKPCIKLNQRQPIFNRQFANTNVVDGIRNTANTVITISGSDILVVTDINPYHLLHKPCLVDLFESLTIYIDKNKYLLFNEEMITNNTVLMPHLLFILILIDGYAAIFSIHPA
ncbi:hypothetical protein K7432_017532 [Basidiobolus ranarum]|uniref:Uncharacterized protein n=1 Tax=Basidiobolus ranarum TaxID=34480 RepID=A0ABR2WDA3_9FUNG